MLKSFVEWYKREGMFVKHHIESFNDFIERRLQNIVSELGEIEIELPTQENLKIKLGKVLIGSPEIKESDGAVRKIHPMEARTRRITYSAPMFIEMTPVFDDVEHETDLINIAEFPIMVKSNLCPLSKMSRDELAEAGEDPDDPGGYFIINGVERVLILSEDIASNKLILQKKKAEITARIDSKNRGFVQRHMFEVDKAGVIVVRFANLTRTPVPVVVLMRALGLETDKEIINAISGGREMVEGAMLNIYATDVATRDDAVNYIGRIMKISQKEQLEERVERILDAYLLPHLGQDVENRAAKARFLGSVINKIERVMAGETADDIDHYANKRLRLAGDMLESIVRSILLGRWGLIARLQYNYQKMIKRGRKLPSLQSIVVTGVITKQIMKSMAVGDFAAQTGVSQRLDRLNFTMSMDHMRAVMSPLSSTQEHFEARELHATHWGRLCAVRTPEGQNIGLRKFLALGANVSTVCSDKDRAKIKSALKGLGVSEDLTAPRASAEVYVNGIYMGTHTTPEELVKGLREKRRKGIVSGDMNVAYISERDEVQINTDAGRARRPLIIVENGKPLLTEEMEKQLGKGGLGWHDVFKNGAAEWLDAEEEENALIALSRKDVTKEHSHAEIDPVLIVGAATSTLVFAEKNRGDRQNYGARMAVQAVGLPATNYLLRDDTTMNVLAYPQIPLVDSQTTEAIGFHKHPSGQNVVVAIAPFFGYNIEDALVVNKASLERGVFRSVMFRGYSTEFRRYWGGQEDEMCVPDPSVKGYRSEDYYVNLDEQGVINPETEVVGDDVLIGKISPLRFLGITKEVRMGIQNLRENSLSGDSGYDGIVEKVVLTVTNNGNRLARVMVRNTKQPEVGDKLATRHGQKGVIGLVVPEEDMPVTADGITPDIIVNPHAIPSRMTVGQLLEIIAGKTAALEGERMDGTLFKSSEQKIMAALNKLGFMEDGKETLYNGITGDMMESKILIGMCYYQRLHHMVSKKIHARSRGPVALMTKQPTEGRSKEGGLRIGEMEKDCLIAHGAPIVLKERFGSDKTVEPVCKDCGVIAVQDRIRNKTYCPLCKSDKALMTEMPYAFKLMLDELRSMTVYTRIVPKEM